jgi:hypothetical protein
MCLTAAVLISSTAECSKLTAGAAFPFAVIGDTVIVPFQMMGYMSKALIEQGQQAGAYTQYSSFTYEYNEPTFVQLVFYIPGYLMLPFSPLANFPYYPMTSACIKQFSVNEKAYRRNRTMY